MSTAANQHGYDKENGAFFEGAHLWSENASYLKKNSLLFFALTIALTLIVTAGLLYELTNNRTHILPSEGSNSLTDFRAVFLTGSLILLLFTLVGGMLFFKRNVLIPLETTGEIVHRMADGHLDKSINIKTMGEVAQVADGINSLAINMQEVLLYAWNHAQQNVKLLDRISEQLMNHPDCLLPLFQVKEDVAQMHREIEELTDIITSFDYFEVKLEHEKMVSDPLHDTIESKA